jgi:Zn-dependent peptidase ImmA (M78 family)
VSDWEVKQVRTAARIIETVEKLIKKYDTRDPYELCKCLGIKIHFYDMEKKLKGFFFYQSRQKNIVIDSNVNDILERILVAHELGHAVLHTQIAMMKGFQEMEVLDGSSLEEDEANFFAAELLLEDSEVLELLSEYSFFETAKQLYVPAALLDYKFSLLHEKGELVNPMYIRKSDFLKDDLGDYDDTNHFEYE